MSLNEMLDTKTELDKVYQLAKNYNTSLIFIVDMININRQDDVATTCLWKVAAYLQEARDMNTNQVKNILQDTRLMWSNNYAMEWSI